MSSNVDVQKGISELNELLEVIQSHRASWKQAEKEKNSHNIRENNPLGQRDTPLITKRDSDCKYKRLMADGQKQGTKPKVENQPNQKQKIEENVNEISKPEQMLFLLIQKMDTPTLKS